MEGIFGKYAMLDKNKLFWTILFTLLLCLLFWLFSRYPALDTKTIMEGDTNFNGIGFTQAFSFSEDAPAYQKIFFNTLNWIETNRQGMTFGILFAAALMLLFSLLEDWKPKHPLVSSILGMFIGFPLGVCVNCAAPIAQGVYKGGGRTETALSMMISSPTLNVVVLTMTFSIFPFYMAMLKLLLSLFVVLLAIPIITHFVYPSSKITSAEDGEQPIVDKTITPFQAEFKESLPTKNILEALTWFIKSYSKRLWYIIKKTVPLMLLAGLLGNVVIQFLPWDILGDFGVNNPLGKNLLIMLSIALVGVLLPVPMTFDIIVVTVLMASGLPPMFAMVLLFTLGSFSIYSFFIVWQTFRLKLALSLSLAIVVLSIGGGLVAHKMGEAKAVEKMDVFRTALRQDNPPTPQQIYFPSLQEKQEFESIESQIKENQKVPEFFKLYQEEGVTVHNVKFDLEEKLEKNTGIAFKKVPGKEIGLSIDVGFNMNNEYSQISQSSCISAGDIQKDGWQDVVLANMNDVYLFINTGKGNYLRQSFEIPALGNSMILTTVLVDLNNDDWLDLFIGTYQEGNYVVLNKEGNLAKGELVSLGNDPNETLTLSPAFADVDQNSTLDIYLGNWTIGMMGDRRRGFKASKNFLLTDPLLNSRKTTFLKGPTGETLTSLFTDFNKDGIQDLIVGNDFQIPELFYEGVGDGTFRLIHKSDSLVLLTTRNCMSIAGVDLDNDLELEYFMAGSSAKDLPMELFIAADAKVCEELLDPIERKQCEEIMSIHEQVVRFRNTKEISSCSEEYRADCIALDLLLESVAFLEKSELRRSHFCDFIPSNADWRFIKSICEFDRKDTVEFSLEERKQSIPNIRNRNVFLRKNSKGNFNDRAEELNLEMTGWSWNAQFADFDNDQYSDVFVNTGTFHEFKREPNHLYKNDGGKRFIEVSEETGLDSYLPSYSSIYTDFDNDGDLDLIVPSALAPIQLYENQSVDNKSIVIELKDSKGNRQGVGSKIIISYEQGGQKQLQEIKASGGYRSFNPIEAWFGLGSTDTVDEMIIEWSTGEKQVLEGPFPSGNRYIIHRNEVANKVERTL